jgi:hypothetical protein
MDLNMDPSTLFTATKVLANKAGLDTRQIDGIVALGGYNYLPTTSSNAKRELVERNNVYT